MKFAVLDIEGTGGKPGHSRIMEIAVYVYDAETGEVIDSFSSLVNPGKNPDGYVRKMTGITPRMLKRAPKFHEIAKRLVEMTRDTVIAAHNADYDYAMLQHEFARLGYDFRRPVVDTFQWARKIFPEETGLGLDSLARKFKIPATDRHRAFGDAKTAMEILKILWEKDPGKQILTEILRPADQNPPHEHFKIRKLLDRIPHKPGILYLYDKDDKLLYAAYKNNMHIQAEKIFSAKSGRRFRLGSRTRRAEAEILYSPFIGKIKTRLVRKHHNPPFSPFKTLSVSVELPQTSFILIDKGRTPGEKSATLVSDGRLEGYAFVRLNEQLRDVSSLRHRLTPLEDCPYGRFLLSQYLDRHYFEKILPLDEETSSD